MNLGKVKFCKKCVMPSSSAIPVEFDENGVCSGCNKMVEEDSLNWDRRGKQFEKLLGQYKNQNNANYDCIIPVSGGKDSYFQIHVVTKELGMRPLLVTYHGNNYTPTGLENLKNMREVFGVDHVFHTPAVETLKVLNRLGMIILGDMNWHAHAGIFTYPIRVSVEQKIPLMIWGEHGRSDVGGMFSYSDFIEFTYRHRHEHACRGYEWNDIIEKSKKYGEKLTPQQMITWMYPNDERINEVGTRGIYISNYFNWDANKHGEMVIEKYGFKVSKEPFERTYRLMSNLDDMHENGIHDYMKFVKFGYGRASDHATKDIRSGRMSRDQGIEEVRKRDHIKSNDLDRWLEYVSWTEEKFDKVADTFRNPRVWWIKNGEWWKDNVWGEPSSFGKVNLAKEDMHKFYNER